MYGFKDSSEVTINSNSGVFGLNKDGKLTKFELNQFAGSNGAELDALDIAITKEDNDFRLRIFPVSKAWAKKGGEITDTTSPEYKTSIEAQSAILNATISDIVKCFVPKEKIEAAFTKPISSFSQYIEVVEKLVKSNINWNKIPVDFFLQYQHEPQGDKDKTYLELPKNVKQGSFFCLNVVGDFAIKSTNSGIKFVTENGEEHPFKRSAWFKESPYSNQIKFDTKSDFNKKETPAPNQSTPDTNDSWL